MGMLRDGMTTPEELRALAGDDEIKPLPVERESIRKIEKQILELQRRIKEVTGVGDISR